jgi:hypothetical protein
VAFHGQDRVLELTINDGTTVISFHCGKSADKEVKHTFTSNARDSQVTSSVSNILLNILCNSFQIRLPFALGHKWH